MRETGGGKREEIDAEPSPEEPKLFGAVMKEWQMTAPAALARSIDHACGVDLVQVAENSQPERDLRAPSNDAIRAAEQLLDRVLVGACESRDSALDLLTVDALVTRAMESAARDPKLLAELPELAMKRLSAR